MDARAIRVWVRLPTTLHHVRSRKLEVEYFQGQLLDGLLPGIARRGLVCTIMPGSSGSGLDTQHLDISCGGPACNFGVGTCFGPGF